MMTASLSLLACYASFVTAQFATEGSYAVRYDTGRFGPDVEVFHYFFDQWPTGIAMTEHNKTLVVYPRGENSSYTLGLVNDTTSEEAYPSLAYNTPNGSLYTMVDGVPYGSNSSDALISASSVFITTNDIIWVLDSGRPTVTVNGVSTLALASEGGPKLVGILAHNASILYTYTFPSDVVYPDSYLKDVRFNLLANATASGAGIAYIADSSPEGRTGFVMLDLGTGSSWRQLSQHPSTISTGKDIPSFSGVPFYTTNGSSFGYLYGGLDGIELSLHGDLMYYSTQTSASLFSINTSYLNTNPANSTASTAAANVAVVELGEKGGMSSGFVVDSLGMLYMLMPESNAVYIYNTTTMRVEPYVKDPRMIYPDRAFAGYDGYIYYIVNQLYDQPAWNDAVDKRQYPGLLLKSLMPNNASRALVLGAGDPTGNSFTSEKRKF